MWYIRIAVCSTQLCRSEKVQGKNAQIHAQASKKKGGRTVNAAERASGVYTTNPCSCGGRWGIMLIKKRKKKGKNKERKYTGLMG